MDETFKESVIEKIEQLEKQVSSVSQDKNETDEIRQNQEILSNEIEGLKPVLTTLNNNSKDLCLSLGDISVKLDLHTRLIKNPLELCALNVKHFRWLFCVTIVLGIGLALSVSKVYLTRQKLDQYKANDTKYRNLELINNKSVQELLYKNDSIYRAELNMRKEVIAEEKRRQKQFELMREAQKKEAQAKELRKKASKK